jgi:hypothetical protein
VQLYDERFYRMWLFYLAGAESSFIHGSLVNWQLQYVKRRDAVPMVRDYLQEKSCACAAPTSPPTGTWRKRRNDCFTRVIPAQAGTHRCTGGLAVGSFLPRLMTS